MKHKVFEPKELKLKPFEIINDEWMLITAGNGDNFNTMTASWGGLGTLWNRPVTFGFIRPSRYTYEFIEQENYYTLCFFDEGYREQLSLCGTESGRNVDKVRATGLTPVTADCGAVYFEEAELVLVCRKLYYDDLKPEHFLDGNIEKNYQSNDYHRMYIGEVIEVLKRK